MDVLAHCMREETCSAFRAPTNAQMLANVGIASAKPTRETHSGESLHSSGLLAIRDATIHSAPATAIAR